MMACFAARSRARDAEWADPCPWGQFDAKGALEADSGVFVKQCVKCDAEILNPEVEGDERCEVCAGIRCRECGLLIEPDDGSDECLCYPEYEVKR